MSDKIFKIVGNDLSDGYHTFGELYEHRCLLFIALVKTTSKEVQRFWVRDHLGGWDLLVLEDFSRQTQEQPYLHPQISYHVPIKFRPLYERLPEKTASAYQFDGHTAADVLNRLMDLSQP